MPDVKILKDFIGGLIHHPIDTLSGHLEPPSEYNKPAYTKVSAPTSNDASAKPTYKPSSYVNGKSFDKDIDAAVDAAS